MKNAPKISDYLSEASKNSFELVKKYLELVNVPFYVDESLVRGLDYYTNTIFEIEMNSENKQGQSLTICAGGRYDDLMKSLDGPDMGCVGFAFGIERLAELIEDDIDYTKNIMCELIPIGPSAKAHLVRLAQELRMTGISVELDYEANSLKQHFKRSESNKSKFIIICGDDELNAKKLKIKNKLTNQEVEIEEKDLIPYIVKEMNSNSSKSGE